MYTYTYAVFVTCGEKLANSPDSSYVFALLYFDFGGVPNAHLLSKNHLGGTRNLQFINKISQLAKNPLFVLIPREY